MKKSLKQIFKLILGGALSLTIMSCSNLFDQTKFEDNTSIVNVNEARSANTTDIYNKLSSRSSATNYNATYDMYTVDGSKIGNDWYFFVQDLSKYAGKTVTINFQTSIFVRNSGSTKKLEWIVKSADGYSTIASGNYYNGESPWGIVSGSGTYKLDSNSCIYLATYGITTSNVKVTIADTTLKVTTSGNTNTNPTPYPDNNNSSEPEDKRVELYSDDISSGSYTSNFTSGNFKILATSEKNVSVKSKKASLNGKSFKKTISLNGGGSFEKYRAISFYAKAGDKIRVYAEAGDVGRYLALSTASGFKKEKEIATEITSYTYAVEETGTHNLYSTKNGINIYYVAIIPGNEEINPGTNNEDPITPPSIEYPYTDIGFATKDSIKQGDFYTDSEYTVYNSEENNYLFFYDSLNVNTQTMLKYDFNVSYPQTVKIEFSADVHGVIFGELAEFAMFINGNQVPIGTAVYEKTEGETQTINFCIEDTKISTGKYLFIKNINPNAYVANIDFSNVKFTVTKKESAGGNFDTGFITEDSIKQGEFYTDSQFTIYNENKNTYTLNYSKENVTTQTLLKYKVLSSNPICADINFTADIMGIIKEEEAEFAIYLSGNIKPIESFKYGNIAGEKHTVSINLTNIKIPADGYLYLKNINENSIISSLIITDPKVIISESESNIKNEVQEIVDVDKIFNTQSGVRFDKNYSRYNYVKQLGKDNIIYESDLGKIFNGKSGTVTLNAELNINAIDEATLAWYLDDKKIENSSFSFKASHKIIQPNIIKFYYDGNADSKLFLKIETDTDAVNNVKCEKPEMTLSYYKK